MCYIEYNIDKRILNSLKSNAHIIGTDAYNPREIFVLTWLIPTEDPVRARSFDL